jgi:hypothetical protein
MWELRVHRIPGGFLKVGHGSGIQSSMYQCYITWAIVTAVVAYRNKQTGLYFGTPSSKCCVDQQIISVYMNLSVMLASWTPTWIYFSIPNHYWAFWTQYRTYIGEISMTEILKVSIKSCRSISILIKIDITGTHCLVRILLSSSSKL